MPELLFGWRKFSPKLTRDNIQYQVIQKSKALLIFDDMVTDKNFSYQVELVLRNVPERDGTT